MRIEYDCNYDYDYLDIDYFKLCFGTLDEIEVLRYSLDCLLDHKKDYSLNDNQVDDAKQMLHKLTKLIDDFDRSDD